MGSDVGLIDGGKYEMMPLTDAFALLSATLGVVFATMGCVAHTRVAFLLFSRHKDGEGGYMVTSMLASAVHPPLSPVDERCGPDGLTQGVARPTLGLSARSVRVPAHKPSSPTRHTATQTHSTHHATRTFFWQECSNRLTPSPLPPSPHSPLALLPLLNPHPLPLTGRSTTNTWCTVSP
jgi:hypothetical protein